MRDQRRGTHYAAMTGAAIFLSLAAVPAQAQGVPGGSYLESCAHVRMFGDRLVAECRQMDGGWARTALGDVGRCVGGIANLNGQLTCNYGELGYGSSYDQHYRYLPYYGR